MELRFRVGAIEFTLTVRRAAPEPKTMTVNSEFDWVGQQMIVDRRYEEIGRRTPIKILISYDAGRVGRFFASPVPLTELRYFCRRAGYSSDALTWRRWTRKAGGGGPFSEAEFRDLLMELERHSLAAPGRAGGRAPRILTEAGRDFCHHVLRSYPTGKNYPPQ
jgi:hypothetical protein